MISPLQKSYSLILSVIATSVVLIFLVLMHTSVYAQEAETDYRNIYRHWKTTKSKREALKFLHKTSAPKTPGHGSSFGVAEAWVRHYGDGDLPAIDAAFDLTVDALGNVYVIGYTTTLPYGTDYLVIKYDPNGELLWQAQYDGPGHADDRAEWVGLDKAGNVYVSGISLGESNIELATIKYTPEGTEQWVSRYHSQEHDATYLEDMAVDALGNACITGYSVTAQFDYDWATVKYNSIGNELWKAQYNGPANRADLPRSVIMDDTGNVYVTGWSTADNGIRDMTTIKYDTSGTEEWIARYNKPGNNTKGYYLTSDKVGNIYVAGARWDSSDTQMSTVAYAPDGTELWVRDSPDHPKFSDSWPHGIMLDDNNDVYLWGGMRMPNDEGREFLLKYDALGAQEWVRMFNIGISVEYNEHLYLVEKLSGNPSVPSSFLIHEISTSGQKKTHGSYEGQGVKGLEVKGMDSIGNIYGIVHTDVYRRQEDAITVKFSLTGEEKWLTRYDGEGRSINEAIAVFPWDDGVMVVGKRDRYSTDYSAVKYQPDGTLASAVKFEGPGYFTKDFGNPIAVSETGNIYVTGTIRDSTSTDFLTMAIDEAGNQLWQARFNGEGQAWDLPMGLALDGGGNVIIVGHTGLEYPNYDIVTIKYNQDGTAIWNQIFDGMASDKDFAADVVSDAQGNVYVTGSSINEFGNYDYLTIKYNAAGNQQWVQRYDGPANSHDYANRIALDSAGDPIVTGGSMGMAPGSDFTTVKYDSAGAMLWEARFDSSSQWVYSMILDQADNVYITGEGGTVKYNTFGEQIWSVREHGDFLAVDSHSNLYFLRERRHSFITSYDIETIKLDSLGNEAWRKNYTLGSADEWPTGIIVNRYNDVYTVGSSMGNAWSVFTILKYSQQFGEQEPEIPDSFRLSQNYPNPFNDGTIIRYVLPEEGHVKINIYDVLGREVETLVDQDHPAGEYPISWQPKGISSGMYFYRLQVNGFSETRKLLFLK